MNTIPLPQLREEFDRGVDVQLDEEHSVHDVAALLKEFLRDMADPLLTKELYTAFINTTCEKPTWLQPFSSAAPSPRELNQAKVNPDKLRIKTKKQLE